MSLKSLSLIGAVLLAGCSQSPESTRVVNMSNAPLRVIYTVAENGAPQTVQLEAGEAKLLGVGHRLAGYASVEFRGVAHNVIFRDSDPDWRDSGCRDDCKFVWFGNGRVAITA